MSDLKLIRICRNPNEPFYWDADRPDEPCPSGMCEGAEDEHETYVLLAPVIEALQEAEQRLRVAREESDKGNEVTAYSYISTGLNGIRSFLASLSQNPTPEETT